MIERFHGLPQAAALYQHPGDPKHHVDYSAARCASHSLGCCESGLESLKMLSVGALEQQEVQRKGQFQHQLGGLVVGLFGAWVWL